MGYLIIIGLGFSFIFTALISSFQYSLWTLIYLKYHETEHVSKIQHLTTKK